MARAVEDQPSQAGAPFVGGDEGEPESQLHDLHEPWKRCRDWQHIAASRSGCFAAGRWSRADQRPLARHLDCAMLTCDGMATWPRRV